MGGGRLQVWSPLPLSHTLGLRARVKGSRWLEVASRMYRVAVASCALIALALSVQFGCSVVENGWGNEHIENVWKMCEINLSI